MEKSKPSSVTAPPGPPGAAPAPPPSIAVSRPAPPEVLPVTFENIRYQQVMNAQPFGHSQRTGYLAAYQGDSTDPLWLLKVYDVTTIEHLEQDVQEVYFTRMEVKPGKRQLLIENESGHRYVVDLDTKAVSEAD